MEEDLGNSIELKPKKPRSEAQIKAFEKAREIRLENAKIKKEKIAQVKEDVKNRNKVLEPTDKAPSAPTVGRFASSPVKPPSTTGGVIGDTRQAEAMPALRPLVPYLDETAKIKKQLKEKKIIEESEDEEVVVVKKKKKPKVIYVEESDDEPAPTIIKKQKEPQPLVNQKPPQTIRFF